MIEIIAGSRLVAILRLDDLDCAVELSDALLRGGIVAQEFTLTNPSALSAIARVRAAIPSFSDGTATIGVGSVRTEEQAQAVIDSGAAFVVTPTLNRSVITLCSAANVPVYSGAFTPTEIAHAWQWGASMVKVFPARGLGPNYIKDVLAPMPDLQLMPTGGVDLSNMQAYFDAGAAAVGVGGNLLDANAIARGDWDSIENTARKYANAAARDT